MAIWVICTFSQPQYDLDDLFQAIEIVEAYNPEDTIYKGYLGYYQISYAYWLDSNTSGVYVHCIDKDYSRLVMINYWKQYAPEALENKDYEVLARIHNGGPDGPYQEETLLYWKKVRDEMLDISGLSE